jgi:DNA-binding transcriptional ArsR family regulator
MDAFSALAEPTRRDILELLASNGKMPATAIYKRFKATPPAISQHLKVLKDANLVSVQKKAQQRIYYVNPEPMKELEKWIKQFCSRVEKQYSKLDALLEKEKLKQDEQPQLFDEL